MSSLLFPRPIPAHYEYNSYPSETLFIPKSSQTSSAIPCFYFPAKSSRRLLIFAHHQSDDVGTAYRFCKYLQQRISINVLAFEYPGYGCCVGVPCESSMYANILSVIQFVLHSLPLRSTDIFLHGVSLGSSLCCYAASHFQRQNQSLGGVILQSPFTSLSEVSYAFAGSIASAAWIENSFATMMYVKELECPLLFLHGKRDVITPNDHSQRLFDAAEKAKLKSTAFSDTATHSEWDNEKDIIPHITAFLSSLPSPSSANAKANGNATNGAATNGTSTKDVPADEVKTSDKDDGIREFTKEKEKEKDKDKDRPLRFDSSVYLAPPSIIDELDNRHEAERLRGLEDRRRKALEDKSSSAALRIRPLKEIDEEEYARVRSNRSGWVSRVFCCRSRRRMSVMGSGAMPEPSSATEGNKKIDRYVIDDEKRTTIEIHDKSKNQLTPLPVTDMDNVPLTHP